MVSENQIGITKRSFAQCIKAQIKSPAEAGFDLREETAEQGSKSAEGKPKDDLRDLRR